MDPSFKVHARLAVTVTGKRGVVSLAAFVLIFVCAAPSIAQVAQGQRLVDQSRSAGDSMNSDVDLVNSALYGDTWKPQSEENPIAVATRMDPEEFEKNLAGLGDPDSDVRKEAIGEFLKRSWGIDTTIVELLKNPNPNTRMSAIEMSKKINLRGISCVQALSKVMREDGDWTVRRSAAIALAHLGRLETHPKHVSSAYRAYYTLGRADEENPLRYPLIVEAVDDMLAALGDNEEMVRKEAVKALGFGARDPPEVDEEDSYYFDSDQVQIDLELLSQMRRERVVPALIKTLEDSDEAVREEAALALGRLGPDSEPAVPIILKNLTDDDWQVREGTAIALGQLGLDVGGVYEGLANALDDEMPGVRAKSARAIAVFGARDVEVVGKILAMASERDPKMRAASASALGTIPDDARIGTLSQQTVDTLSVLLEDHEEKVREVAAKAIGRHGRSASPYVEQLHKLARFDDSPRVRANAAEAIGKTSNIPERSIQVLRRVLRDRKSIVVERAVWSIGEFGPYAAPAFKQLSKLIDSYGNEKLVETTMEAFTKIGPAIIPVIIEELVKRLEVQDNAFSGATYYYNPYTMGFSSGMAIEVISDMGEPAVGYVIKLLDHDRERIRITGAQILGAMGSDAEAALRPLTKMFKQGSIYEKGSAARALVELGDISIPTFVEAMKSRNPEVRLVALGALGMLDVDPAILVPILCENLESNDVRLRTQAMITVTSMGTMGEAAIPCVIKRLYDPERYNRRMAPTTLVVLGPKSSKVRSALLARIKRPDRPGRANIEAVYALARMGSDALPALPELAEIMNNPGDETLQVAVMEVISEMGWDAREYFDTFVLKLSDGSSSRINRASVQAIANLSESMFSNMDSMGPLERQKFIIEMDLVAFTVQDMRGQGAGFGTVIRRIQAVNSAIKQREAERKASMSFFARSTESIRNSEFFSKYWKFFAIGLVLLIGGGAGGYSYYRKKQLE